MQIDFVITELFLGGAERCLTELAIGMADAGDKVRVFSIGSLPTDERGLLVDRLKDAGIEVSSAEAKIGRSQDTRGRNTSRRIQCVSLFG